ncbi:MAG TPA: hypothetical protein VEO58_01985 [Gemmatimonadales bacterium]|nr:hypothetical protein [Gemmatimonadales bacterium]
MFAPRLPVCMVLALWPTLASAQDSAPDTIPFHRHQWAAQFAGGTTFASLGVLRFTAPTRAWLLDFRFTGGHSHDKDYVQDTLVGDGYTSSAHVDARIGRRFYQGRGKAVVSFQTVGVLGGYAHDCSAFKGSTVSGHSCSNGWTAGAYGELGGAYLITRRFSIGGTATVAFSYQRSTARSSGGVVAKRWSYAGSIQGLSFAATVYF